MHSFSVTHLDRAISQTDDEFTLLVSYVWCWLLSCMSSVHLSVSLSSFLGSGPKGPMSCRTQGGIWDVRSSVRPSDRPSVPPLGHWSHKSAVSGLILALWALKRALSALDLALKSSNQLSRPPICPQDFKSALQTSNPPSRPQVNS